MSQSTESTTESNPFTKPGFIIAAALVVALIAAAVVIFLLPKGQDSTAQPAPASSASRRSPQPAPALRRRGWEKRLRAALQHGNGPGRSTEVQVGARRENGRTHRPQNLRSGRDRRRRLPVMLRPVPNGCPLRGCQPFALGSSGDPGLSQARRTSSWCPARAGMHAAKADILVNVQSSDNHSISWLPHQVLHPTEADVDLAFQTYNGALGAHGPSAALGGWGLEVSSRQTTAKLVNDIAQLSDLSGFIAWSGA